MLEKKQPRAIILENNEAVLHSANLILSKQGWDVTCERISQDALQTLSASKQRPIALFITNFRLPKMTGDDILEQVKKISPLTRRMIMVSPDEPDIFISAINRSLIHACITAPFQEEDLIYHSRNCFQEFKKQIKRKRLKRVTRHQNQQMFKIAQKLKQKDESFRKNIEKKKTKITELKSLKNEIENQSLPKSGISLASYIKNKGVHPSSDIFLREFITLCQSMESVFNLAIDDPGLTIDFNNIFGRTNESKDASDPEKIQETVPVENHLQDDDGKDPQPSFYKDFLSLILAKVMNQQEKDVNTNLVDDHQADDASDESLDRWFELAISEEGTAASLIKKQAYDPQNPPELSELNDWLSNKLVLYGIIDNDAIMSWLKDAERSEIVIAEGDSPAHGSPGTITYHFDTDFTQPGTINEDGSIDFRDRGEIPFIEKGTLLAELTPAVEGHPGKNVSGILIPVDEVSDPLFIAGSGTEISENGLTIHAIIDGQPNVDAMGTFYVSSELVIKGDVDFETGNIDFNGNIIVNGMVKEGFTVKGISLTAQEIEGAVIDLSGDLNVSGGITDSSVKAQGNIQAKFINNSQLIAFGDLIVSKEIIDSEIFLSGGFQNHSGHIISSKIAARKGGESCNIGTTSSMPVRIKIGGDEHIKKIESQLDEQLEQTINRIGLFKEDIEKQEQEDLNFYENITKNAHIQDRAQVEAEEIRKSLPEIEQSNDLIKLARAEKKIKLLTETASQAEKELNTIFEAQNILAGKINEMKTQIHLLEEKKALLEHQKASLNEFIKTQDPVAELSVSGTASQGTIVKAPHAAITFKEDRSRCKVTQIEGNSADLLEPEMVITDL